jgi:hypothetical protein
MPNCQLKINPGATYIQRRNLINLDVSLNVPTLLIPVWGSECHAVPGSIGESHHFRYTLAEMMYSLFQKKRQGTYVWSWANLVGASHKPKESFCLLLAIGYLEGLQDPCPMANRYINASWLVAKFNGNWNTCICHSYMFLPRHDARVFESTWMKHSRSIHTFVLDSWSKAPQFALRSAAIKRLWGSKWAERWAMDWTKLDPCWRHVYYCTLIF